MAHSRYANAICVDCGTLVHVELIPICSRRRDGNGEVLCRNGWRTAAVRESPRAVHLCQYQRQALVHACFLTPLEMQKLRHGEPLAIQEIARQDLRMRVLVEEVRW